METSILLLSVYPEQSKAGTRTNIYTALFIAVLLKVIKSSEQTKHPPTDEWLKTVWCLHTKEYFSALKYKEIMRHTVIQASLVAQR